MVAVAGLCASAASGAGRKDPERAGSMPMPHEGRYVQAIERLDRNPVLVVRYPWFRHRKPSVEVRQLFDDEVGERLIYPLYFRQRHFRGDVIVTLYRAVDRAETGPTVARFTSQGIQFEALATRNSLGKAAASVACRTDVVSLERKRQTPRAVYPLLEPWALDERMLYLDLPRSHFAAPCKLRLWLMRDGDIVWAENVDWPGYPQRPGEGAAEAGSKPSQPAAEGAEGGNAP